MSQSFTGTFDAANELSSVLALPAGQSVSIDLVTEALTGSIVLERATKGLAAFDPVLSFTDEASTTYKNRSQETEYLRLRCVAVGDEESVDYTLAEVDDEVLRSLLQDKDGVSILDEMEDGTLVFNRSFLRPDVNGINSEETVTTNGDASSEVGLDRYHSKIVSGGSAGTEDLNIGDGTGAIVGQRKLITFLTRTNASDSIVLDHANFSQASATITAIALDAAGEFILAEWQGAKWEIIKASSGVVTTS
jgi:hypothetical protein